MDNATIAVMPHLSHGSSRNGWNLCHLSNELHAQCMPHVRRVCDDLTPCVNPEQDENDSGHHTMDVVKLEGKSCHNKAVTNLVDKRTLSQLIPVIT
jgi:hypothetical protein